MSWRLGPGVIELPDGTRLRGRSLRREPPPDPPPDWGLYLGRAPDPRAWPGRRLRWPDFSLPRDLADARAAFEEAYARAAAGARVEVACSGGRGRTGTALACIAQLGGVPPDAATRWIRAQYHPRAVETPWQRRYVRRFGARGRTA